MSIFTDIFGCATLQLCNFLPRLPRFLLCLCPLLGSFSPELSSAAVFSSRRYSAAFPSYLTSLPSALPSYLPSF